MDSVHAATRETGCGADQPAHRDFAIATVATDDGPRPVRTRALAAGPFARLLDFACAEGGPRPPLLMVPPISGHFPILMRDVVTGLLPDFDVTVLDWTNVRHVPVEQGGFGFDDNIRAVEQAIARLGPDCAVLALCQGGVPALAATARLSAMQDTRAPAALALLAAPIDPMAGPTEVVRLIRRMPHGWYRSVPLARLPGRYAGRGRRVYPAETQLAALRRFRARDHADGGELERKFARDDGADPDIFPFRDLYSTIMDIDGQHFAENIERVFLRRALVFGRLRCAGAPVTPAAIRRTALMTIEGEHDVITAPGQTAAAHALCTGIAPEGRTRLVVPDCGHFSLFHGDLWRARVLPALRRHCLRALGVAG